MGSRRFMLNLQQQFSEMGEVGSASPSRPETVSFEQNPAQALIWETTPRTVRRHINWNNRQPDLREDLAHLFQDTRRRICGIASAGSPSF